MIVKWINRRRRNKRLGFGLTVVATIIAAFALTYWWPSSSPSTERSSAVVPGLAPLQAGSLQERTVLDSSSRFSCEVASVTDGDTLRCEDGTRIRLHAVAAREMNETCSTGHPCPSASGASAKAELQRLTDGGALSCLPTGRSYNRVTAICWTPEDVEVNCAMIRSGTTIVWERFARQNPVCRNE